MIDLTDYIQQFDPTTRKRGEAYYWSKRVQTIKLVYGESGSFRIRGSETYDVHLKILKPGRLKTSCSCPYFAKMQACKHVWAAIIAGNYEGMFQTEFAVKSEERAVVPEAKWKHRVEAFASAPRRAAFPRGTQVLGAYVIPLDRSSYGDTLTLEFHGQDYLKDGSLGRMKRSSVSHEDVRNRYPDALDKRALRILLGPPPEYSYYSSGRGQVPLDSAEFFPLLKEIAQAGRLYTWISGQPLQVLATEDMPANFFLKIRKAGAEYNVSGAIRFGERDSHIQSNTKYRAPFLIHENVLSVAYFQTYEHWLDHFRTEGALRIPKAEIDSFLKYYFELPFAPELDLPKELKFKTERQHGKIRLQLERHNDAKRSIQASLLFEYGTEFVRSDDARSQLYDGEARVLYQRDFASEQKHALTIPPRILDSTLGALIEQAFARGWEIVAFKKILSEVKSSRTEMTSGIDWFDLSVDLKFSLGQSLSLPQLLKNLKTGDSFVQLGDGTTGYIHPDWIRKLTALAAHGELGTSALRMSKLQALYYASTFDSTFEFKSNRAFGSLKKLLVDLQKLKDPAVDPKFLGKLRPYQKQGVAWLNLMAKNGIGSVLADDMGLGKTIQVLSVLSPQKKSRTLIVAPKSLVYNWVKEADRFVPHLRFHDHTGTDRATRLQLFEQAHVIVTTYHTLRLDIELFQGMSFDHFIMDEAHQVKNTKSQAYMACKLISAKNKIALSGTPVENSIADLFSILSITTPGLISPQTAGRFTRETDPEVLQALARGLKPFILRRTKDQVLKDLPSKTEQVLYCELSESERQKYNELKKFYWSRLSGKIQEKGFESSKIEILEALLRLRQAACHPGLLNDGKTTSSTKFEVLLEQLQTAISEGHKVLVFSQFTALLALLKKSLIEKQIRFEYLDGKTSDRGARVESFQNDKDISVFLISLKAGGVGLNLTAADYVFILDPWWNPAAEAQAIDRAHRIGQKKKVFAYKLIAKDTVEEKILQLQESKRALAKAVVAGDDEAAQGQSFLKGLKAEDLAALFG